MAANQRSLSPTTWYTPASSPAAAPANQLPCSPGCAAFQRQPSSQEQQQEVLDRLLACLKKLDESANHGVHSRPVPFLQAPCNPAATLPLQGNRPYAPAHLPSPSSPSRDQQQPAFQPPHPSVGLGLDRNLLLDTAIATSADGRAAMARVGAFLLELQRYSPDFARMLSNQFAVAAPAAAMGAAEHVQAQHADTRQTAGAGLQETDWGAKLLDLQLLDHEKQLLGALAQPMGFHKGKPLAALVVFRACLQWGAFKADPTHVFDGIIQVIEGQIGQQPSDNACLAYWLTNTATLRHLLQRTIKPMSTAALGVNTMDAAPIDGGCVRDCGLVEANYSGQMFKLRLQALVEKIYSMMRDNVEKHIEPMLRCCIGLATGMHGRAAATTRNATAATGPGARDGRGGGAAAAAVSPQRKAWRDTLDVFDELLVTLQENHVPKPLVQALFKTVFSFANMTLFNQLLLWPECFTFSNGECMKVGLFQVESWIMEHGSEWVGEAWEELKCIRQAVAFLVISNKPKKSLQDITGDMCPVLSIQQLYRISNMYWDDKYNTQTVSSEVLGRTKQLMEEQSSSNPYSHGFLLDSSSCFKPLVVNDIMAQMDSRDLYGALPVPEQLKSGSGKGSFAFLEQKLRFS